MPTIVRVDADRQLVVEVSDRHVRRRAEHQTRVFVHFESRSELSEEVTLLLPLGPKPRQRRVGQHPVEDHQALDSPDNWRRLTVPVIWFADRGVERFVEHVEDSSPLLSPNHRGRSEPPGQELLDEVVHLLAMSDAREGAVLAADEYPGVQHHCNEETGLTIREAERRDRIDAIRVQLPDTAPVHPLKVHIQDERLSEAIPFLSRCLSSGHGGTVLNGWAAFDYLANRTPTRLSGRSDATLAVDSADSTAPRWKLGMVPSPVGRRNAREHGSATDALSGLGESTMADERPLLVRAPRRNSAPSKPISLSSPPPLHKEPVGGLAGGPPKLEEELGLKKSPEQELAAAFERLVDTAATLNAASDALAKPIAALDSAFKELNIGVTTWVNFHGAEHDPSPGWEWGRSVGYAKVNGRWGIAIRDYEGRIGEPFDRCEEWLFGDAPRSYRVHAVEKLPKLVEALAKEATRTAEALQAKVASATTLADTAQSVVRARKARR